MSEQKYYVRLDTEKCVKHDFSNSPYSPSPDYIFWLESDGNFGYNKHTFTLLELEKISQEKLARDCGYDDLSEISLVGNIVGDYWVNPLIELIPVEELKIMSEQKFYEVLVVCNDEYMYFRVKAFDEDDAEMKVYYGDWVNEYTDEEIENSFIEEINECD